MLVGFMGEALQNTSGARIGAERRTAKFSVKWDLGKLTEDNEKLCLLTKLIFVSKGTKKPNSRF